MSRNSNCQIHTCKHFAILLKLWLYASPLSVFCISFSPISAQNILFRENPAHLKELNDNAVLDIVQDAKGYLWFGTYNGLYKYDGFTLTPYIEDKISKKPIPRGPIKTMLVSKEGQLWVSILGSGLIVIDLEKESYKDYSYSLKEQEKTIPSANIHKIIEDEHGNMWMATKEAGIIEWITSKNTFRQFTPKNSALSSNYIPSIYQDNSGKIWAGGMSLVFFDPLKNTFANSGIPIDKTCQITCIYQDRQGFMWFNISKEVFKYDIHTNKIEKILIQSIENESFGAGPIFEDDDVFWIGTYSYGLFTYNKVTKEIRHFSHDEKDRFSICNNIINKIIKDNSGNIWIGTQQGAIKINPVQLNILSYYRVSGEKNSLSKKEVRAIYEDNEGVIWASTPGEGVNKISPDNKIQQILIEEHFNQFGYNYINWIYPKNEDELYLACEHGLMVLNKKTKALNFHVLSPFKFPKFGNLTSLWAVMEDKTTLWIGTKDSGLYIFNKETNKTENYRTAENTFAVWSIYKDKQNNIWLGTDDGIKQVVTNGESHKIISYDEKTDRKSNIFSMCEDLWGRLWLATSNAGLKMFDPASRQFASYSMTNGLPSNTITGILIDDSGIFWISTINGLCKFDPRHGKVISNYGEEDGLLSNHFNFNACCKGKNGRMLFAGVNGINIFNPRDLKPNLYEPDILITGIKTLYGKLNIDSLKSFINLPYTQNTFFIDFSSTDYSNPGKIQFAYLLEGTDKTWNYIQNTHSLSFVNLRPGNYTLKLKTSNSDGLWSGKIVSLSIIINPPFWQTWWFYSIAFLTFILFLTYFINAYLRAKNLSREKTKAELAALRSQLNPHFVFNSLSSLQSYIAKNENQLAMDYLLKFSRLMRRILENSKSEFISLAEEIDFLELYTYMESKRLRDTVKFDISCGPGLNPQICYIPPMLIQPIIENAIIHGLVANMPNGQILVYFEKGDDCFYCRITDNGIGREEASKNNLQKALPNKSSMGLKIAADRLKIFGMLHGSDASIKISNLDKNTGTGTVVEIRIPIINNTIIKTYNSDTHPDRR